jgi:XTP/dITP diphosphohydrolase
MFRLVLGTGNRKKREELEHLIRGEPMELFSLNDFPTVPEPEETGQTFAENAAIKAEYYAKQLSHWVLAEDSGLSVAVLGGAPGVYSARYAGLNASDETNNQLLLSNLKGVELDQRSGFYSCHIALADPAGRIIACSDGRCCGRISREPQGSAGFGYDPLFEIVEYKMTFAEIGPHVKAVLSHRGRAYRKLLPQLRALARSIRV